MWDGEDTASPSILRILYIMWLVRSMQHTQVADGVDNTTEPEFGAYGVCSCMFGRPMLAEAVTDCTLTASKQGWVVLVELRRRVREASQRKFERVSVTPNL